MRAGVRIGSLSVHRDPDNLKRSSVQYRLTPDDSRISTERAHPVRVADDGAPHTGILDSQSKCNTGQAVVP